MTFDEILIQRRLTKILEEIEFLRSKKKVEVDDFLSDGTSMRAVSKAIELIVQSILDICSHIIAQRHWGISETYRGTITLLASNNVISQALAKSLQQAVAMRNLLVHQYLEIDFRIIWDSIDQLVNDASEFSGAIRKYLASIS